MDAESDAISDREFIFNDWKESIDSSLDVKLPVKDHTSDDIDDDSTPRNNLKHTRSSSISSGVVSSSRKRMSAQEKAASISVDGMTSLATSMTAPKLTRFDQCMEILKEMEYNEEIKDTDLFRISRAFIKESEHYAALFFGLPSKLRVAWLEEENLLTVNSDSS